MRRLTLGALLGATLLTVACGDRQAPASGRHGDTKAGHAEQAPVFGAMQLLAPLPIGANDSVHGVSAPFAGMIDDRLVVAGGCNFPGKPASAGGAKVYYSDIYCYDAKHDRWQKLGDLPKPLAYGAAVADDDRLYIIGGNNDAGASASVYELRLESNFLRDLFGLAPKLRLTELAPLPEPMDNFAAACLDDMIFVAGGNQSGRPGNRVYGYSLESNPAAWLALPDYPGPTRVQPVLTAIEGRIGHRKVEALCLMGGFQAGQTAEGIDVPTPALAPDEVLLYPIPDDAADDALARQALTVGVWEAITTMPSRRLDAGEEAIAESSIGAAGAFAVAINDQSFVVGGGVDKQVFLRALDNTRLTLLARAAGDDSLVLQLEAEKADYLKHPVAWYNFNDEPFYFIGSDVWRWVPMGAMPQTARAGASAVYDDGYLYVIGGELMPGVRSAEVSRTWIGLEDVPETFMGQIVEKQ